MHCTRLTLLAAAASAAVLVPSSASAQLFDSGRTVISADHEIDFGDPVKLCLKFCHDLVVERQTFTCTPYFETPTEGCDLPWIDPENPNPDYFSQGLGCIPPKPTVAGYHLDERVELVLKAVRQTANCVSTVSETVLQTLPDRGNPPRACDRSAWTSSTETIRSFRRVTCP